jgi:hypothetical protein
MEGLEIIEMIKQTYRPKQGFSLEIYFVDEKYCLSVFKIKEIKDKKNGTIEAAPLAAKCGVFTKNKLEFKDMIETYCTRV